MAEERADTSSPGTLALGLLGRPHGVAGEMVFRPFNSEGVALHEFELPLAVTLVRGGEPVAAVIVKARPFKEGALVRLESVDTREAAAALTNAELLVPRSVLPPLDPDENYIDDLIGCTVTDQNGRARGVVRGAFWNGVQSILEVRDDAGGELLVPAVGEWLLRVDLERRAIEIDDHE